MSRKRKIRVGEREAIRDDRVEFLAAAAAPGGVVVLSRWWLWWRGVPRRCLRIEESVGLREVRHLFHVPGGFAGIVEPGLQADARIRLRRLRAAMNPRRAHEGRTQERDDRQPHFWRSFLMTSKAPMRSISMR